MASYGIFFMTLQEFVSEIFLSSTTLIFPFPLGYFPKSVIHQDIPYLVDYTISRFILRIFTYVFMLISD